MIRPFTCLTLSMALGAGLYLYTEKHRTTLLDQHIRAVAADTERIRDRTAMLRAEWALLNQPDRLQGLAARFLPTLVPVAPTQFVQLADLGGRLPPVAPPAPRPVPPATLAPAATPAPALLAAATATAPARDDDAGDAAIGTPAPAPHRPQARLAAATAIRPAPAVEPRASRPRAPVLLASARMPRAAAFRHQAGHPGGVVAPPIGANPLVREAEAYAQPRPILAGAWRPMAPAFTGSALGMAHMAMSAPVAPPMAPPLGPSR